MISLRNTFLEMVTIYTKKVLGYPEMITREEEKKGMK